MCIRRFWCLSHLHYEQVNWPIQAAPSCLLWGAWVTRVELSAKEISDTNLAVANKNQPSTSSFCTASARMETMMKRAQTLLKEQNVSCRPRWRTWFMNGLMTLLCSSPHTCIVLPAFVGFLLQNIGVLLMCGLLDCPNQHANSSKNLGKLGTRKGSSSSSVALLEILPWASTFITTQLPCERPQEGWRSEARGFCQWVHKS